MIETFSENSHVPPEAIAAAHLAVRRQQEQDGTNRFSDIYDSQADLTDLAAYYITGGGNFFVATDSDGALQGFVGLRHDGDGHATLKRLAVLPDFEGRGIGTTLVQALINWATQHDFRSISLQTGGDEQARERIYLKLGFKDVGRLPRVDKTDEYLMKLDLTST